MKTFDLPITNEVDNGDGTHTIYFNVDDKFKKQFMKNQGLKRWSQKRFEKVFIREVEEYMRDKTFEEMRSGLNKFAQRYNNADQ
tara:strand:- start:248 stop:499 length:252 start_codon:yes stop_codon:yes gene_type:complete